MRPIALLAACFAGALFGAASCAETEEVPPAWPAGETPADAGTRAEGEDRAPSEPPAPPEQIVLSGPVVSLAPARPSEPKPPLVAPEGTTEYAVEQTLDDAPAKLSGTATITYVNTTGRSLASLPLLLHPNASAELGVHADTSGHMRIDGVTVSGRRAALVRRRPTLVEVRLPSPLAPGSRVVLVVRYAGRLRTLAAGDTDMMKQAMSSMGSLTSSGGHAADYGLFAVGDGIVTTASAYPMVAPWREGSFDTSPPPRFGDLAYNAPANFHVRTVVPRGMALVTNLVDGASEAADGAHEVVLSDGKMVRDLVLVAGRDLVHASLDVGSTRVSSYYRAGDERAGRAALDAGGRALATFERRFGPYPWPVLNIAEASIVGGAGGVEFCGMTLIASMFYRPPDLSSSPLGPLAGLLGGALGGSAGGAPDAMAALLDDQLEFVVAHEVAHQYFAGVVGNDSRRYAALDEPLAQFAASLAIEERKGPAAAAASLEKYGKTNYALYRAMGGTDRAAARASRTFATPAEYGALVYGKAPYVYVALRSELGDEAFFRALRGAVDASRFRMVTLDEWTSAVERNAGDAPTRRRVGALFHRYLHEAQGDGDLGVDDSGDLVLKNMLPMEGGGDAIVSLLRGMGMTPRELFHAFAGGEPAGAHKIPAMPGGPGAAMRGLGGGASLGDPAAMMKLLEQLAPH